MRVFVNQRLCPTLDLHRVHLTWVGFPVCWSTLYKHGAAECRGISCVVLG